MGEQTFLMNKPTIFRKATAKAMRLKLDIPLLLTVISLIVFGLLMVYSASWEYAFAKDRGFGFLVGRQVGWVGAGIAAATAAYFIPYRWYQKAILVGLIVTIFALMVVLFIHPSVDVPNRTLAERSIQPSEMAKLVLIIYLSVWLNSKRESLNKFTFGLIPMMVILGFMGGLIALQPDISAAATVVIIGGMLFFLAKADIRQVALVIAAAIGLGFVMYQISDTAKERLSNYVQAVIDPNVATNQVKFASVAINRGQIFGVGIGKGITKNTILPVAWTDSIFAVIIEETGVVGAIILIGLYLMLLWRGLRIAARAPDFTGRLMAGGITLWITLEAIINMGVMVNLLPVAGNALPFISYGGSSMLTTLTGIGVLMNIHRSSMLDPDSPEGRLFSAVVDMRWRDRRRRLSRTRRPRSTR